MNELDFGHSKTLYYCISVFTALEILVKIRQINTLSQFKDE